MSKQREVFEVWAKGRFYLDRIGGESEQAEEYAEDTADAAWKAWQASRAVALEEGANLCDGYAAEASENAALEGDDRFEVYAKKYRKAAIGIRALKEQS